MGETIFYLINSSTNLSNNKKTVMKTVKESKKENKAEISLVHSQKHLIKPTTMQNLVQTKYTII